VGAPNITPIGAATSIGAALAYLDALLACGLAPDELAAQIKAKLAPVHAAQLDDLIRLAPPERLKAVLTTFLKGLEKAEKAEAKAEAKRTYNRDRNRVLRGSNNSATGTTSTTRQHGQH
jgi:hypothetical protein